MGKGKGKSAGKGMGEVKGKTKVRARVRAWERLRASVKVRVRVLVRVEIEPRMNASDVKLYIKKKNEFNSVSHKKNSAANLVITQKNACNTNHNSR